MVLSQRRARRRQDDLRARLLRALGVTRAVRSPTYTLVELYPLEAMTVVHADLYRLRAAGELEALGLRDWAQRGHLWFVEWPERAPATCRRRTLSLRFSVRSCRHTPSSLRPVPPSGSLWLSASTGGSRRACSTCLELIPETP